MKKINIFNRNGLIFKYLKLIFTNYSNKNIDLMSNSLTFVTAFAIFPFFSLVIGISKGFGLDVFIVEKISNIIPSDEKILSTMVDISKNLIESLQTSVLAGLSIILLIWSVLKVLLMLETVFNEIWHIGKKRKKTRQVVNYVAIILMLPILLILILGSSNFMLIILKKIFLFINFDGLFVYIAKILNFSFLVMLIALVFVLIPNGNIEIKYSIYSSFMTTIAVVVETYIYMNIQQYINSYNAIYGSLAFVPIFLIWLKLTWTLVLLGAEVNYLLQTTAEITSDKKEVPLRHQKYISLYIYREIIESFKKSKGGLKLSEIYNITGINQSNIMECLNILEENDFIYEIKEDDICVYQLKINPENICISDFFDKIELDEFNLKEIFDDESNYEKYFKFISNFEIKDKREITFNEL